MTDMLVFSYGKFLAKRDRSLCEWHETWAATWQPGSPGQDNKNVKTGKSWDDSKRIKKEKEMCNWKFISVVNTTDKQL